MQTFEIPNVMIIFQKSYYEWANYLIHFRLFNSRTLDIHIISRECTFPDQEGLLSFRAYYKLTLGGPPLRLQITIF